MDRLDQVKETVEVFEDEKRVILHYPNASCEYNLSRYQAEYHKLMARIHRRENLSTGYITLTAETLAEESGLSEIASVNLTERDRIETLKSLNYFRDTTVGLWATDRPELFKDHPRFDLLFEIKK